MRQLNDSTRLQLSAAVLYLPFLLALPVGVLAQDYPRDEAVLHGLSYHTKARPSGHQWNKLNWGLAWRHAPSESLSWQFGAYRDSVFKPAAYGLVDYTPLQGLGLQAGGFAGAKASNHSTDFIAGAAARYQASSYSLTGRVGQAKKSRGYVYTIEAGWRF